jgi:osmoprotectant transport system ATP-binding protein
VTSRAPAAIELRDVTLQRGEGRLVLDRLSLVVDAGETLALVGRSGAGKSSLLKLINGLLRPDSGTVIVGHRDTREWNPFELRRHAGFVLQEVGLFPHLSVGENVALVPRLLGWDAPRVSLRVDAVLRLVGLDPATYARRPPRELSGGQRQRVGVARALAADPPLLLMDEPFGALDPVTRAELHAEFRAIQRDLRKTVVIVTHDMAEAFALADRIGVLAGGAIAAIDTPPAISRSTDPRVHALLRPLVEARAATEGRA